MQLIGVVAMTKDGCIGKNGGIPWHHKEDFKHFRKLTLDSTIIMGRLTWDSLPKRPLERRNNVVITRQYQDVVQQDGAYFLPSMALDRLLMTLREPHYVIGGEQIFNLLWASISTFHVTIVDDVVEGGDAFMPKRFFTEFKPVNSIPLSEHCVAYKYVREK